MPVVTEALHTGGYLLSEGAGRISRDQITVAAGDALLVGQVLTRGANGVYAPYDAANEATAPATAILYAALPASANPRPAVATTRLAEIAKAQLTGVSDAAIADLASHFIIVR
ncbi:Head decoration protein [Paraburkholderia tropica]